jgi:hypothetical protein
LVDGGFDEASRACSVGDEYIAASREQILSELLNGSGEWSQSRSQLISITSKNLEATPPRL